MATSFEYERECREIHEACDHPDIDAGVAVALARKTPPERRKIKAAYRRLYGEDLEELVCRAQAADQQNEVWNALRVWLLLDPPERDAVLAREAVQCRAEVDYRALVEIYSRSKLHQLFFTKQAYQERFKSALDQDILKEPSHAYQKLLLALSASRGSHRDGVSRHVSYCDAKRMFEARSESTGSINEAAILELISKRSVAQFRLALCSYKNIYGHEYPKSLKNKSAEFESALRVVIRCIHTPAKYYSKMLRECLRDSGSCGGGGGRMLTRAIIGSEDAGMEMVKVAFEKRFGMRLVDAIVRELPESDYKQLLVAGTSDAASQ